MSTENIAVLKSVGAFIPGSDRFLDIDVLLPLAKGAGSYLAGMAVAIPILNVDGRRHANNFSKNI